MHTLCATQCATHMPDAMPETVPKPMRNAVHERTNEDASLVSNVPVVGAPARDEPDPWPHPEGPDCPHGMPGGHLPDPFVDGRILGQLGAEAVTA